MWMFFLLLTIHSITSNSPIIPPVEKLTHFLSSSTDHQDFISSSGHTRITALVPSAVWTLEKWLDEEVTVWWTDPRIEYAVDVRNPPATLRQGELSEIGMTQDEWAVSRLGFPFNRAINPIEKRLQVLSPGPTLSQLVRQTSNIQHCFEQATTLDKERQTQLRTLCFLPGEIRVRI